MKTSASEVKLFPRQLAVFALASAIAIPVWAQDQVNTGTSSGVTAQTCTTSSSDTQAQPSPMPTEQPLTPAKEGFWGRVNPFARKKWVKKQIDPINDRLTELDEVNATERARHQGCGCAGAGRNPEGAVDGRRGQPDRQRMPTPQAQNANSAAQQASSHVNQYQHHRQRPRSIPAGHRTLKITSAAANPVLTADSKQKLDQLAAKPDRPRGLHP